MRIRRVRIAALIALAAGTVGCGDTGSQSTTAQPKGQQQLKKGGRSMPAPPPIEKVGP